MKRIEAILSVLALALLLLPRHAQAVSHVLNPTGRPAAVATASGATRVFALAGHGESDTTLVWKDPDTDWQRVSPPPVTAPSYYDATGVTAVTIPGQSPAVYVVTVERTLYSYPSGYYTVPPALWEYVQGRTVNGVLSEWRKISDFPRASGQSGSPAISAVRRAGTGEVWVAVRTFGDAATGSAVYACQTFGTATPFCRNVTCDAGNVCTYASNASPVGIALNRGFSGLTQVWVEDVFTVNNAGSLQHDRHTEAVSGWDRNKVVGAPVSPAGSHVDQTAIQLWPPDSTSVPAGQGGAGAGDYTEAVVVATAAAGLPPTLQFLRKGTGLNATETWTWSHVYLWDKGGQGEVGADNGVGNLFLDRDGVSNARRIWALSGAQADGTHAMHLCYLSTTPTTSTVNCDANSSTDYAGQPADIRPAFDGLGPAFTVRNDTVWTVASVGRNTPNVAAGAEYLYSLAYFSGGDGVQGQWRNHLTWRDRTSTIAGGTMVAEYPADEFYGTVAVAGIERTEPSPGTMIRFIRTWRSTDDGSTWVSTGTPFGDDTGMYQSTDPSVGFDSSGNAYLTAVRPFGSANTSGWTEVTRWNSATGSWDPAAIIPVTYNTIRDRAWFYPDPSTTGVFYLTYTDTANANDAGVVATFGSLSYCKEVPGVTCVSGTPNGWCPVISLHSSTHCNGGKNGAAGCPILRADDGNVWVAVGDDDQCTPVTSNFDVPGRRAVGLRRVVMGADGCPSSLTTPECIFYDAIDGNYLGTIYDSSSFQNLRQWNIGLSATRDGSHGLLVSLRDWRDTTSGLSCTETSIRCRSDVYAAYRDASRGQWCGTSCGLGIDTSSMLRVNPSESTPLAANEYINGGVVALDGNNFAVDWFHATGTTSNAGYDAMASRLLYSPSSGTLSVTASDATITHGAGVVDGDGTGAGWYGDFENQVSARLHAHLIMPASSSLSSTQAATFVWTPSTHSVAP